MIHGLRKDELGQDLGAYKAGGFVYQQTGLDDDAVLKAILRENAMDSWVSLATEHEPSYFASQNIFGFSTAVLARTEKPPVSAVGMCSWADLPVHVNGDKVHAAYLAELRVMPEYRNRLSVIRNGFKSIQYFSGKFTPACWFTSIARENVVARRLLESGLPEMPSYRRCGEMRTIALSTSLGRHRRLLQQAQIEGRRADAR